MKTIMEYIINNHIVKDPKITIFDEKYSDYNDIINYTHLNIHDKPNIMFNYVRFFLTTDDTKPYIRSLYYEYNDLEKMDIHKLIAYCKKNYNDCANYGKNMNPKINIEYYSKTHRAWVDICYINMIKDDTAIYYTGYSTLDDKDSVKFKNIFNQYIRQ